MKLQTGDKVRITKGIYKGKECEVDSSISLGVGGYGYQLRPLFQCKYPKIFRTQLELEKL